MPQYSEKRRRGNVGESIACTFLKRKGYRIVHRNYLQKWGEIDIIAERGHCVHFVEVKTVSRESGTDFSREMDYRPEELVGPDKLQKLARTAAQYMHERHDDREFQIDVVGVVMDASRQTAQCRHFLQVLD